MKFFKITVMMLLLLSCNVQNEQNSEANSFKTTRFEDDVLDTILERNNPANLDLSRHQLFIDTTRDSEFYLKNAEWEFTTDYFLERPDRFKTQQILIGNFPKKWVSLKNLDGKFVLYDRCDGIDRRFEITDSTVNVYGELESESQYIKRLLKLNESEIQIELASKEVFSIRATEIKNVFSLVYFDEEYLVTPF